MELKKYCKIKKFDNVQTYKKKQYGDRKEVWSLDAKFTANRVKIGYRVIFYN